MDDEKIDLWVELLDSLTAREASAFLGKLHQVHVKARQKVFQHGECDDRLIFIDSGELKLSYWSSLKRKNEVFAHLSKGDICGTETFFTQSPHTTSLTAIEDSIIRCLNKKDYIAILSSHPAFEKKLIQCCEKHQKKIVFQDPQELGRRAHQRHMTSLKGWIQRIDPSGKPLPQTFSVTISDISIGGLGCSVKKLGIADAENLFQHQVQATISYHKNSLPCDIQRNAKVVSVRFSQLGTSTIHLQFQEPLPEKQIIEMVRFDSL